MMKKKNGWNNSMEQNMLFDDFKLTSLMEKVLGVDMT